MALTILASSVATALYLRESMVMQKTRLDLGSIVTSAAKSRNFQTKAAKIKKFYLSAAFFLYHLLYSTCHATSGSISPSLPGDKGTSHAFIQISKSFQNTKHSLLLP